MTRSLGLTASLNRSAEGLEGVAGSGDDVARAVARADLGTGDHEPHRSESVLGAAGFFEAILQKVEAGEGTLGQLWDNPDLYNSLYGTLESLRLLIEDIKENPGGVCDHRDLLGPLATGSVLEDSTGRKKKWKKGSAIFGGPSSSRCQRGSSNERVSISRGSPTSPVPC